MLSPIVRRAVSVVSPLRYPGGKKRLSGYIAETLRLNGIVPKLFVEPFAGSASVSIQLLCDGAVEKIALGERDPLVASFWKVVFSSDLEWLIERVKTISVTVKKWEEFRANFGSTNRERALACLFLNRTSFSGILDETAGPIGGREQRSEYKIDCRFPRETLARRLREIGAMKSKVLFVNAGDWLETVSKVEALGLGQNEVCYYLDPPFYNKADRLYRFFFNADDHQALHDRLVRLKQPWILSYDPAEQIRSLYAHNGNGPKCINSLYSANMNSGLQKVEEFVITTLPVLPTETRLWRTQKEWKVPGARPARIAAMAGAAG